MIDAESDGYEYDEEKSRVNFQKHGIDFGFASRVFESDYIEREDPRRDYGEKRLIAIGPIEADIFAVVYTWRYGRRRIISARRASKKERDAYRERVTGTRSR